MIRLLLAATALIAVIALARWLGRANAAQRSKMLKLILLYGAAAILLLLVITGRLPWLFALIGAALPWLQRAMMARRAWNTFRSMRQPQSGQNSRVETAFLRMTLDHDTGDLNGEVIQGTFSGSKLLDLSLDQLLVLLDQLRTADAQSAALLEAYLDRTQGASWRKQDETTAEETVHTAASTPMNRQEAAEILGVSSDAPQKVIIQAHRRLIQRLHSDRGGSDYLAAMINKAKDVLLKK